MRRRDRKRHRRWFPVFSMTSVVAVIWIGVWGAAVGGVARRQRRRNVTSDGGDLHSGAHLPVQINVDCGRGKRIHRVFPCKGHCNSELPSIMMEVATCLRAFHIFPRPTEPRHCQHGQGQSHRTPRPGSSRVGARGGAVGGNEIRGRMKWGRRMDTPILGCTGQERRSKIRLE